MADRLNVKIVFSVTTMTGDDYHSTVLNYSGLPYEQVVAMQLFATDVLKQMTEKFGGAAIAAKKASASQPGQQGQKG